MVADSVKKKLPVFVCLCFVFGCNHETILCHEKGIEGLFMIFFKSLVLLVHTCFTDSVKKLFPLFIFFPDMYIIATIIKQFCVIKGD